MRILSVLVALFLFSACGDKKVDNTNNLEEFAWLKGEWMDSSSSGKMVELWNQVNDSLMVGSSIYLAGEDTIFFEEISLNKINDDIFYIPSIQAEEGMQPTKFKFISSANGELVFENKEHDFPQRIVYTHPLEDSLIAYIDGKKNGEYRKEFFRMKRIK
jgi:hypothetical protein